MYDVQCNVGKIKFDSNYEQLSAENGQENILGAVRVFGDDVCN